MFQIETFLVNSNTKKVRRREEQQQKFKISSDHRRAESENTYIPGLITNLSPGWKIVLNSQLHVELLRGWPHTEKHLIWDILYQRFLEDGSLPTVEKNQEKKNWYVFPARQHFYCSCFFWCTLCQKSDFCSKIEFWLNLANQLILIFAPKFNNFLELLILKSIKY